MNIINGEIICYTDKHWSIFASENCGNKEKICRKH